MKFSAPVKKSCPPVRFGVILFAIILPLIRTLIIYPVSSVASANGAGGFLNTALNYLGQAVTVSGFFGAIACTFIAQWHKDKTKSLRALTVHIASLFVIGFLIQNAVLILLSFLDEKMLFNFYLGNYTLSQLLADGLLSRALISGILNILILIAIILVSYAIAGKQIAKSDKFITDYYPLEKKSVFAAVIVFLVSSAVLSISETVMTIINYGAPAAISDVLYLAGPYFGILITSFIGWVVSISVLKHYEK